MSLSPTWFGVDGPCKPEASREYFLVLSTPLVHDSWGTGFSVGSEGFMRKIRTFNGERLS